MPVCGLVQRGKKGQPFRVLIRGRGMGKRMEARIGDQ